MAEASGEGTCLTAAQLMLSSSYVSQALCALLALLFSFAPRTIPKVRSCYHPALPLRKVKSALDQSHRAVAWQSQDSNPDRSGSKSWAPNPRCCLPVTHTCLQHRGLLAPEAIFWEVDLGPTCWRNFLKTKIINKRTNDFLTQMIFKEMLKKKYFYCDFRGD